MSSAAQPASDEALAATAADRSDPTRAHRAADQLLTRYRERIYRGCMRYTREPEAALDLTQEVMLKVYRALPSFAGRARFSTWLYTIVRNECIGAMRRHKREIDDGEDFLATLADAGLAPDTRLEAQELERRLDVAMRERLTPLEQDAMWLRCIEMVPVDTITETLGIQSASGARGVLQAARRKLRAALAEADEGSRP